MIVKERKKPEHLLALEALMRRTYSRIDDMERDLSLYRAGFKGEESFDYHLKNLSPAFHILHDVRLQIDDDYTQLDTILLSEKFIVVIEVKNFIGKLTFDEARHQLIRTLEGKEEAFLDPLLQVRRQKNYLRKWLNLHSFPDLPLETLIVISKPSTIIETSNPSVLHSAYLPFKISELASNYEKQILGQNDLLRLGQELQQAHTPRKVDVLQKYQIRKENLRVGVYCPGCTTLPMARGYGKWKCSFCGLASADAHIESLRDYRLLVGDVITNRELRWFLQIDSERIARSIIQSLYPVGKTKGRRYRLDFM
ncbi:nuclease-related domain-containing protein [Halobacillus sp. Marseille-P3879]|uniref:nuclease-related domain-containing protein n=1 Tax=Halobacillus sp. Marseille-P3879 TaxID=2045014 RepID=UPI00135B4F8A|nr:nuclease-related domain-containing protein [Halobacillus sp. Marseille-P3879]